MIGITFGRENRHGLSPSPMQFGATNLTAPSGIVVTPPLLLGLGNDGSDFQPLARCIDSHKSKVRRSYVLRGIGDVVLNEDFHSYFHRSLENTVNRRLKNHQISNANWNQEVDVIDRRCHDIITGVTMRGHGSREIDPVHQTSA